MAKILLPIGLHTLAQCLKITKNVSFEFLILTFFINIFPIKIDRSVILFDRKLQIFKNSPKLTIFGILNYILSTQNVNAARFAHNVE